MGLQAPALALRQQDPGSGPIPVGLEICRPRGSHRHSSCLRPQLVAIRSAGGFVARRATSIGTGQAKTPVTRSTRWPHHPQQSSWLGRHQKHHLEDPVVVPRRAARRPQQPVGSRQAVRVTHVSCFTADSGTGRAVDASQAMATRPALLPTAVPPALTAQHRLVPCALKPNSAGGPTQLTGHRVSPCALNPIPEMGPTVIVKHRVPCALEPTSVGPREGVSSEVVGEGEAVGVEGVSLALGKANVLRGCSLSVPRGKLWMLLGPNGCGKSTLLKVLAGLLVPDSGRVAVQHPRSFVFQNPDHQVVMPTVEADVAFGLGARKRPLDEAAVRRRVLSSLDAVGMLEYARRSVQTLSGGQKQRVAIAGALAQRSRLLLLDELTTFLDSSDQMGVLRAVRRVVGGPRGVSALWVTHRLEELRYADGAAYMDSGAVVVSGSAREVEEHILRLRAVQRQQPSL